MTKHTIKETISVLEEQIEVFRSQIEPTDTGNLHTTIAALKHRVRELKKHKKSKYEQIYE